MFRAILAMSLGMLLASDVQAAEGRNYGQTVSHCNHLANAQKVKGQARKEFVQLCADLRADELDPNRGNSLRQSKRYCTARADQRWLAGDARLRFIERCVDLDRGLSDPLWSRHHRCHERARSRGLTGDRRHEFVMACLEGYRAYNIASNRLTTDARIRSD